MRISTLVGSGVYLAFLCGVLRSRVVGSPMVQRSNIVGGWVSHEEEYTGDPVVHLSEVKIMCCKMVPSVRTSRDPEQTNIIRRKCIQTLPRQEQG